MEERLLVKVSLLVWTLNISCYFQKFFATSLNLGVQLCQLSLS